MADEKKKKSFIEHSDNPKGRHQWFRHTRELADGKLAPGLIGKASAQKRRAERERQAPLSKRGFRPFEAPGSGANWVHLGPDAIGHGLGGSVFPTVSGRITALAAGPSGRVYAGSANGGVWFSSDSGQTWTPLDQWAVSPAKTGAGLEADSLSIGAIAVQFAGVASSGSSSSESSSSSDSSANSSTSSSDSTSSSSDSSTSSDSSASSRDSSTSSSDSVGSSSDSTSSSDSNASSSSDSTDSSSSDSSSEAPASPDTASSSSTSDVIYVGTGEPNQNSDAYFGIGIKVSTDGGTTFTLEGKNLSASEIFRIVIDPADSALVFAATTTGIYRRLKNPPPGADWTKVADPDSTTPTVTDLAVSGSASNRVYFAATPNGVFQSSDIFSQTDGQADATTWKAAGVSKAGRKTLAVGENVNTTVYCLVQDATLFRLDSSTSGSFQQVTGVPIALFAGAQGWYDMILAADPSDADTLYLGGDLTLDGNSWALALFKGKIQGAAGSYSFPFTAGNDQTTPGSAGTTGNVTKDATWIGRGVHPDGHAIAFAANADGTHDSANVWIGCDGGVFQSASSGALGSFNPKNTGLTTAQITYLGLRPDTADEMYAGCQDNGTVRYISGGTPLPWYQSASGDGGGVAINPNNTSQIIRQWTHASLEISSDDGKTFPWPQDSFPASSSAENGNTGFYAPLKALASGSNTLVAFGTNRLWLRSSWNATWVTLPSAANPYTNASSPDLATDVLDGTVAALTFGSPTLILAGTSSTVYRFDQSGSAWTRTALPAISSPPAPATLRITDVTVEDPAKGTCYVALGSGGGEHILYYDGSAWMSAGLDKNTVDVPSHAVTVNPNDKNTVFLGTDVGVWKGVKSGAAWSWTPFSDGLPEAAITDLEIHAGTNKLRAGTHGRGVWEIAADAVMGGSGSSSSAGDSSSSSDGGSSSSSSGDDSSSS